MSETQEQYRVSETVASESEQAPETEKTSPSPTIADPFLTGVLQRIQKVEDRLVLACLPVVLLALAPSLGLGGCTSSRQRSHQFCSNSLDPGSLLRHGNSLRGNCLELDRS